MNNLVETFHRYFEIVPAESDALLIEAYRIRYQVYCVQNAFEEADDFPDRLEYDEYDARAVHSLVRHHRSGHFAGVVRLILPDPNDPNRPFPIETHCAGTVRRDSPELSGLPWHATAEISRFAVCDEFKRRIAEQHTLSGVSGGVAYGDGLEHPGLDRRLLPHITLGLFAGIVRMSAEHRITHWLAVMEPTLMRLLTRFGIYFRPVGPPIEYHGVRQPAVGIVDDVLESIYHKRKAVWEIITDGGRVWPLRRANSSSIHT